ncbi:TM2 domain-containing protein [Spiribacter sp. C176]|uniref:TM2 domain-containing protein n=1 Tax=Spiribacter salilacus TaxID=2664894 RepID=A0A6N7QRL0_9GAMM|nr:TM2 domain-containing protein [Spiribacter salilacus]MRH78039.1 TM2 domain-containing protein [Spiribacter salilacus]
MLSKDAVEQREERIRQQISELPDEDRSRLYKEAEKKLKDPDTYATLNYFFIAGLHYFYLGKWGAGLLAIALFWTGIYLLFTDAMWLGIALIAGVTLVEFYELFKSQLIVQEHNNQVLEELYRRRV